MVVRCVSKEQALEVTFEDSPNTVYKKNRYSHKPLRL